MSKSIFAILGSVAIVIFSVSCVSGKKYASLQDTSKQFMNERDAFKTDNIGLEMKNRELEARMALLDKEIVAVKERESVTKLLRITISSQASTPNFRMHRKTL
jgi:hypothetical protein